ncbi:MAG: phosphoglycerate dehydrogenase [bacterium]
MNQSKIAVSSASFSQSNDLVTLLEQHFSHVTYNTTRQVLSEDALVACIGDAEAVIVGQDIFNEDILLACPSLKFIAKYGVGMDNIDEVACAKHGVQIGWTGGVNRRSVAEMTVAFMLSLIRNLYSSSIKLSAGHWHKSGGMQLSGKTVGIIGMGHIGKEVVELLRPFNCRILANDIIDQESYYRHNNIEHCDKDALLKRSDIVTLHTPLTTQTQYIINKDSLGLMQPDAFLINTARGKLVDINALKQALINGDILGAALDVYEDEPPTDLDFLRLDNLFCTPHIGGNAKEAVLAMGRSAVSHLINFFGKHTY